MAEDINTAARWESTYQNGYLHGSPSRFSNQLYARQPDVNIRLLFTRQPLQSQFRFIHGCRVYTKIVIYTSAIQKPNGLYTLLSGVYKNSLFTRQPFKSQIFCNTLLPGVYRKLSFTWQPFKSQIGYTHCCRVYKQNSHTMLNYRAKSKRPL